MKLKNIEKVKAAEKVLAHARTVGFPEATLLYEVATDESFFDSLEKLADEYPEDDNLSVNIHLLLDEDLEITIGEDGEIIYE